MFFHGNDAKTISHPTHALFMAILNNLTDFTCSKTVLTPFQDTSYAHASDVQCEHAVPNDTFGVSRSTVSCIFNERLTEMDRCLVSALVKSRLLFVYLVVTYIV